MNVCVFVCVCMYMYVCMYVCVCVCVYVYVCVYVCLFVFTVEGWVIWPKSYIMEWVLSFHDNMHHNKVIFLYIFLFIY